MRSVRSRDTGPELAVRRYLHRAGLRYRLHDRRLPGTPDVIFPSRRIAVLVHGCFWHQHSGCAAAARPKTSRGYWDKKLDGNVARDARQTAALEALGWTCLVVWECETTSQAVLSALVSKIRAAEPVIRHH